MSALTSPAKPSLHRTLVATVVAVLLSVVSVPAGGAEDPRRGELGLARDPAAPHSETHILIDVAEPAQVFQALGAGVEPVVGDWYEVPVPAGWEPIDWAREMSSRPGVATAELNLILDLQAEAPFTSPDPLYNNFADPMYQWHLHAAKVGQAWLNSVGAGVVVAVLDSGVSNGPFDGFCQPFVAEYDAVTDTSGPGSGFDIHGHGSHVAGSVAQCSDNLIGGAGMAPAASIMPVRVFSPGGADAADIARGADWAVNHGARVINMSLGCDVADCPEGSSVLNEAIERAAAAGVVMVASAGNTPVDVFYPANHPSVIGVGATIRSGAVASYSARGLGLDLVAPGGDGNDSPISIWQDTPFGYQGIAGTSMAAGHVSGAVALLISKYPNASAGQVRNALNCSATEIGSPGWDVPSGWGALDAGAALEQLRLMLEAGTFNCVGQPPTGAPFAALQVNAGFWRLFHGSAQVAGFYFGNPGDFGFMGDWDCDGIDTPGLYRRSDGYVYLRNSNSQGIADVAFFFGNPGDLPLAGDFDGDGCDTVSIYRPSEGRFYIMNHLGSGDAGLGAAEYDYYYGNPGDAPFMGDWDGDGIDTPGLRRDANGFVYLRHSNSQGNADIEYFYGDAGDVVFTGDWDGDGDDTLGLYRPSNGTVYLRNTNTTGTADASFGVGSGMQVSGGDF
jgi:subtilisin family serine protease